MEKCILKMQGLDNRKCTYCNKIKFSTHFRQFRYKCKVCERDDPICKLKRVIRARIYSALHSKNIRKKQHTIEYLGCTNKEYVTYLFGYNSLYTLENHGKVWHIDHVIPVSKFDLNNKNENFLAFNWRNTMPLSVCENLAKKTKYYNNK